MKLRQNGRSVSVAVIIAVGDDADGRREVLGRDIGPPEAETFWTAVPRRLDRLGLRGVKRVVSDAHEGIETSVAKILTASWQRGRVHFTRNVLARTGESGRRVVSAFVATGCARDDAAAASKPWRASADRIRPRLPRPATLVGAGAASPHAPDLAVLYWRKLEALREAVADEEKRTEALGILRSLIEAVCIHPTEVGYEIELVGGIASMVDVAICASNKKAAPGRAALDAEERRSVKLVAGAHNYRCQHAVEVPI